MMDECAVSFGILVLVYTTKNIILLWFMVIHPLNLSSLMEALLCTVCSCSTHP